jgi:hypothetical protein
MKCLLHTEWEVFAALRLKLDAPLSHVASLFEIISAWNSTANETDAQWKAQRERGKTRIGRERKKVAYSSH